MCMNLINELSRVLAIVKGRETYETWAECFKDVWDDLNALIGGVLKINVDGEEIKVRIYLGETFFCGTSF